MLRHEPIGTYCGLTIILDKASRHDRSQLIDGWAGQYFDVSILSAGLEGIARGTCEIRLLQDWLTSPVLREGTKCVLLLGQNSLSAFKPGASLPHERGSPFIIDGVTYLPTFAPQDAFDRFAYFGDEDGQEYERDEDDEKSTRGSTQRKNWRFWMRKDVQKAARLTYYGCVLAEPKVELWPQAGVVISKLLDRPAASRCLFFDVETDPNLQLTCFGFRFSDDDTTYCVPMLQTDQPNPTYFYEETPQILRALAVAFRYNKIVIHNAMFDLFVLAWRYGIPFPLDVYDTMLAQHRCYPEVEKSLGHTISLHTDNLPYHKNEGVYEPRSHSQTEQLYRYNAKDVYALSQVYPKLLECAERLKATESVSQANSMIRPYLLTALMGMDYDRDKLLTTVQHNIRWQEQIKRVLKVITARALNPNSPKQVAAYYYTPEGHNLDCPNQKEPTNEKTLLQLRLKNDLQSIPIILRYRALGKENGQLKFRPYTGTFKEKYILKGDANPRLRFTTGYKLAGTNTFRLSSSELLGRWGSNGQNIPKKLRKLILARSNCVLLQVDQSGAEALIVAYLTRGGNFRKLFIHGVKPHSFVAMHVFREVWEAELGYTIAELLEMPIEELAKNPKWKELAKLIKLSDDWPPERRYYFIAKMICHASNYGMKAPTFRLNVLLKSDGAVRLTNEQAQRYQCTYLGLFPEIQQMQGDIVAELRRSSMLRNLFGYPRVFTGFIDESMYKEAWAFKPQSTVGCITNLAFVELQQRIESPSDKLFYDTGVDLMQNNHDSILLQCPEENYREIAAQVQTHMNRRLVSPHGDVFFMKSEASVGKSWGEMSEIK